LINQQYQARWKNQIVFPGYYVTKIRWLVYGISLMGYP